LQQAELEIAYRLRADSCLYFEGFSSDIQLATRVTSITSVACNTGVYLVPRIPGREVKRVLGIEEGYASDALPPCSYLDMLASRDHVVDLSVFTELRFVSYTDPITGMPVRCYVVVAKPGVVFEGVLRVGIEEFCSTLLQSLEEAASYGLVLGGLRGIGCGHLSLESLALKWKGGVVSGVREVLARGAELCRG